MLQKQRNEQTIKILERLRKQGAPSADAIQPIPLMGEEDKEDEEEPAEPNPSGEVVDNSFLSSLPGLAEAKKKLKRRY